MNISAEERAFLGRIADAADVFRTLYMDATVTQAVVLMLVGSRPGITQSDLAVLTNLSQASISRIVDIYGDVGNRGNGPYKILERRVSVQDSRSRELYLTPKGQIIMAAVLKQFPGASYDRPTKE